MFGINELYALAGQESRQVGCLLTTRQAMAYFGYSKSDAFLEFVRKSGVPRIRINARRIMFDPVAVQAWIDRRTIGRRGN